MNRISPPQSHSGSFNLLAYYRAVLDFTHIDTLIKWHVWIDDSSYYILFDYTSSNIESITILPRCQRIMAFEVKVWVFKHTQSLISTNLIFLSSSVPSAWNMYRTYLVLALFLQLFIFLFGFLIYFNKYFSHIIILNVKGTA